MNNPLKKMQFAALLALGCATSSFINFGTSTDSSSEPTQDNFYLTINTAPEKPSNRRQGGMFITADWLIWQASESDLAFVNKSSPSTSPFILGSTSTKNPHFKWEFGFRTGLGFNIPHGQWDTYFNYTWFHDRATGHATNDGGASLLYANFLSATAGNGSILPATPGVIFTPTFESANAHWKLRLNVLDWEFGKKFTPFRWFALRTHAGLRSGWIHQNYDLNYVNPITDGVTGISTISTDRKNNYWGLGIRGGFDSQWYLSKAWSLYGNAALSLLYGYFHLTQNDTITTPTSVTSAGHIKNHYNAGRAITDLQLGLRWETRFAKDRCGFSLQAGWEQHVFFEQNEFMRFNDVANAGHFTQDHSNLSVQGVNISALLEF